MYCITQRVFKLLLNWFRQCLWKSHNNFSNLWQIWSWTIFRFMPALYLYFYRKTHLKKLMKVLVLRKLHLFSFPFIFNSFLYNAWILIVPAIKNLRFTSPRPSWGKPQTWESWMLNKSPIRSITQFDFLAIHYDIQQRKSRY